MRFDGALGLMKAQTNTHCAEMAQVEINEPSTTTRKTDLQAQISAEELKPQ
jgi:hypothetical protein